MSDDVLQPHQIDPLVPEFVPDPDLDALFRQAVAVAKEFGWPLPVRAEFEARYKQQMAGRIQQ